MNRNIALSLLLVAALTASVASAAKLETRRVAKPAAKPLALHTIQPPIGTTAAAADQQVKIVLKTKKQNYAHGKETYDPDIRSPKSVHIHPSGKKFYVNSLEGFTTVAYDFATGQKLKTIRHQFDEHQHAALWSQPSGLFPWRHYSLHLNTFTGKPVESTFSHNGRYLWVPYYRRSFDLNAQDPSALAVIDTEQDTIIRLMETGPLPKMITTSPDGKTIAVSHWGNNTVGLIDIASQNPEDWHYTAKLIVDRELQLNYPLNVSIDRDNGSGYALRGTVFTPDNRYLLVGCMGSGGGIAVINIPEKRYLGRITGMMPNVRHLVLSNGYLYLSINAAGMIQRIPLKDFVQACDSLQGTAKLTGWQSVKVGAGARTISLTRDGRYAFAACNNASQLWVVDTEKMKAIAAIDADSYPVGLDISDDGRYVITTSQGRNRVGGNCVDIYEVTYAQPIGPSRCKACGAAMTDDGKRCTQCDYGHDENEEPTDSIAADTLAAPGFDFSQILAPSATEGKVAIAVLALLALVIALLVAKRKRGKEEDSDES